MHTCMTSKSCTYLRSVMSISIKMLFLAASCGLDAGGSAGVPSGFANDSVES
jgi:hypothetical protein